MTDIDPIKSLEYIGKHAEEYAIAKANRRYLEEYRKTLKARLFLAAPEGTVADREAWAYAHDDYEVNLKGLRESLEQEEKLYWLLLGAREKIGIYRTQEASARFIDKGLT